MIFADETKGKLIADVLADATRALPQRQLDRHRMHNSGRMSIAPGRVSAARAETCDVNNVLDGKEKAIKDTMTKRRNVHALDECLTARRVFHRPEAWLLAMDQQRRHVEKQNHERTYGKDPIRGSRRSRKEKDKPVHCNRLGKRPNDHSEGQHEPLDGGTAQSLAGFARNEVPE